MKTIPIGVGTDGKRYHLTAKLRSGASTRSDAGSIRITLDFFFSHSMLL